VYASNSTVFTGMAGSSLVINSSQHRGHFSVAL
jgi:hypothetical protein